VPLDSAVGKYILKKNAERFFPPEMLHRPKRGFDVPIRDWLTGVARDRTRERLLGSAPLADWFMPGVVEKLLDAEGRAASHGWRLWALLVLDEWLSQHRARRREALPA